MIVNQNLRDTTFLSRPNFDFEEQTNLTRLIEKAIIATLPHFQEGIKKSFAKPLGESDLSQEFVIHLNRVLRNLGFSLLAIPQAKDYQTKEANSRSMVDFSFVSSEQKSSTRLLYSVEAKRLPTPGRKRVQEYIWGVTDNDRPTGGIQRFKTGDHGAGLANCALLGFVESKSFYYWFSTINSWIKSLAEIKADWDISEQLYDFIDHQDHSTSYSVAIRSKDKVKLFHFWIYIGQL
ncbi:MAG: hypothetical protein HYV28_06650 [Ignavibacteriales bacterium]|nr:hypothetical protein [Ignavibacteriales bacterium]